MKLTLPMGLSGPTMARIVSIVQRAARNPNGTLSEMGAKYIRDNITVEFGPDFAEAIVAGVRVDLDEPERSKK